MMHELASGKTVWSIGDPHLGKKFETGVPLERRGEREKLQLSHFQRQLSSQADFVVMMGDLFDHPQVAYRTSLEAAAAVLAASISFPDTTFVMLAGNHDLPRNLGVVGAFDAFEKLVTGYKNIVVVRKPMVFQHMAFFPWEWGVSAISQVEAMADWCIDWPVEFAFGHWDLEDYGGEPSEHMVPVKELQSLFGADIELVGGHIHTEGLYNIEGVNVIGTGSMEPYSHGEDPTGKTYVTLDMETFNDTDPLTLKDKCVRILLSPGEEMPLGLDCLALTAKRVTPDKTVEVVEDVRNFQWSSIIEEALKDLSPDVREFIQDRLRVAGE